jgi:hypothetical protein
MISRVGERPDVAAFGVDGFRVLANGLNSPFEEVAAAWWLRTRGLPTIVPRAIYRAGHRSQLDESLFDPRRYQSHARYRASDGEAILETRRNDVTIRDHWNGPDSLLYQGGKPVLRSMNAAQAVERGYLLDNEVAALVAEFRERLSEAGAEVLRLTGSHILVAIGENDPPVRDRQGSVEACLCNFQDLRMPFPAKRIP